jgi:hypothetical protein
LGVPVQDWAAWSGDGRHCWDQVYDWRVSLLLNWCACFRLLTLL